MISGQGLRSITDLTRVAVSSSSRDNLRRVSKNGYHDFEKFASGCGGTEPSVVTPHSPKIVLNFLAKISNLSVIENHLSSDETLLADKNGNVKMMALDTLNGYIQGLDMLFANNGHDGKFIVSEDGMSARGNPIRSEEICLPLFRRRYKATLAKIGSTDPRQASPLGIEEIISISKVIPLIKKLMMFISTQSAWLE